MTEAAPTTSTLDAMLKLPRHLVPHISKSHSRAYHRPVYDVVEFEFGPT
jgi:hypothetical protein